VKYQKLCGTEQALKVFENERHTWSALNKYVEENKVDCDLWTGETYNVAMSPQVAELAHEVFLSYQSAGGKTDHITVMRDPVTAEKMSRINGAQSCYAWQASTLQPRKLTGHLMREAISKGANLQTHTTVTSVSAAGPGQQKRDARWIVHTSRGNIACRDVVHASNAYLPAYLPLFRNLVQPVPYTCSKVVPPRSFSGLKALRNSYGVLLRDGSLISINPRSTSDGAIMFGGDNVGQQALDKWMLEHPEECTNDGFANLPAVAVAVEEFTTNHFQGWTATPRGVGEGFDYSWSGIIGRTLDGVPMVGEIPGMKGQWICAGHCGHGMARIFTAGPGLVKLMNDETWETTGLPEVYRLDEQRLQKLQRESGEASAK